MASVRKRKWTYNGVEKEGWEVRYEDPATGKRPSKTFAMKKDADAFKRKVEREIEDGVHTSRASEKTVDEVATLYVEHLKQRIEQGTLSNGRFKIMKIAIDVHVVSRFGRFKMHELKMTDVEDWVIGLRKSKRMNSRTAKEYAFIFKQMEDYALKRGYTKVSPVADAYKEVRCVRNEKINTFKAEQVAALIRAAEVRRRYQSVRNLMIGQCFVNIAAFCGLRYGEIAGLTIDHVDFEKRVIRVRHSIDCTGKLKGPKTASGNRDVPMPEHVSKLLKDWMSHSFLDNEMRLVFTSDNGVWYSHSNFHNNIWRHLLVGAGIQDKARANLFHFHALRHFCASWLIHNGMSLPDVATFLGHSKFDVTLQVYAHSIVGESHRHDVVQRMANALITA